MTNGITLPRAQRTAAAIEFLSLVLLITTIATVHFPLFAQILGPLHGVAYIGVIILTMLITDGQRGTGVSFLLSLIPGIGGFLTIKHRYRLPPTDGPELGTVTPPTPLSTPLVQNLCDRDAYQDDN